MKPSRPGGELVLHGTEVRQQTDVAGQSLPKCDFRVKSVYPINLRHNLVAPRVTLWANNRDRAVRAIVEETSVPRFENHVKRRFRGSTDLTEAARLDYLGQFRLSGLGAQRHTHLLR